ncbi:hypothetical protein LshimejAT787_0305820 [Lyophyllum shimeji]|uniref:Uncharacterized protein n=1 Tax=Lyophyllum shimeji TaxID=47721 RepID=A0A9P3UJ02_LYOSH|nr:hypothetical protein LshimejAT787_0305820 [Lyophyllum shimeji]
MNGQIFTQGLSIINSPAPNTPFRVGSTLPISIDISGNGRLPASAVLPGSGLRTRYDALEIYLVSSQTAANITVSAGPELLSQETGSVRHLNWPIPSCVPAGLYNMTVYEASHINDQAYFSITAIPVALSNDALLESPCSTGSNALQPQPQPCSPLMQSPFLPNQLKPLYTGRITSQTPSPSGALPSVLLSTTTVIPPPSSVTVVLVSTTTVVTTENGLPVTTTLTTTATEAVATQPDSSGFFPVNSSHRSHIYLHRLLLSTMLVFFALVYV